MKTIDIKPKLPQEVIDQQRSQLDRLLKSEKIQRFMKTHSVDAAYIQKHLGRFMKWEQELSLCDGCQGLFACRQKQNGYILDLTIEDGILSNQISKCHYLIDQEKQRAHLSRFLINDMPEILIPLMLDQFELDNETYDYLMLFDKIKNWIDQPVFKGLYLYGSAGCGKTYLLSALANECAKKGRSVAFIHVPSFVSRAKLYFDAPEEMEKLVTQAKTADVAFFDDIGAESVTAWSRDELLFPIINHRLEAKKSTWFSSNETPDTLKQHYALDQKGKLATTKAIRMIERILALADPERLVEDNRRNHVSA